MNLVAAFESLHWFDRSRLEFSCVSETYRTPSARLPERRTDSTYLSRNCRDFVIRGRVRLDGALLGISLTFP